MLHLDRRNFLRGGARLAAGLVGAAGLSSSFPLPSWAGDSAFEAAKQSKSITVGLANE
jgi:hypothetical protein